MGRGKVGRGNEKDKDEWQEVVHRHRRQYENRMSGKGDSMLTKIFISNLPKGCTPWDVKYVFGGFGEVVSAYIARKNDKFGCRFGFISFKSVRDVRALELRLNGIKMGSNKLRVNIAKFADENVGLESLTEKKGEAKQVKDVKKVPRYYEEAEKLRCNFRGSNSYKDTLENKVSMDKRNVEGEDSVSKSKVVVVPEVTQAFKELYGRALVGRAVNLETLIKLDKLLVEAGIGDLEILYIGGLSVLLKFKDEVKASKLLLDNGVWCRWFSVLDSWKGQVLSFERIAWVKIYGVSLNLAENSVFDSVAACFGMVVHKAQLCSEDSDLSSTCVGIFVGDGVQICDSVVVKWKNRQFKVWVEEESGVWDPDCVGVVEVSSVCPSPMNTFDQGSGDGEQMSGGGVFPINVEEEELSVHGEMHAHGLGNNHGGSPMLMVWGQRIFN
ncbi:nucleotide-binding alpha-beta plait domain-containing protein [Artemisia annua]|uniref:Nucleotide-binding alpha-beta plait domain-containing protein n=1 Tax=Artemisia annua TaxID=35608 RepID=A0A2U1NCF8_ARTAN|nr:nucleotide-binding alpha-beta plait domain-containing protein [Artemisia annua]